MVRKIKASNMGVELEFTIYDNRAYMKCNNAMIRNMFKEMLKRKDAKAPESHGNYDVFEIADGNEESICQELSNDLKMGGFQVTDVE